eukprot:scaffold3470_cov115-Pinguiococcus_pyrenoidosus.AAC.1
MSIAGVGDDVATLPLRAECKVPSVKLLVKEVSYGDCFLRFPYEARVVLANTDSDLDAEYEVQPEDPSNVSIGIYEALEPKGAIPAGETVEIAVRLTCQRL